MTSWLGVLNARRGRAVAAMGWRLSRRWGFVALFFVLAVAPLLQTLTGLVRVKPINENRMLAPWLTAQTPLDAIPRALDVWYADHFGFRPWLIRAKTQIDYSLFDTSDRVLIGKQGQLFYRSVVLQQEPGMQDILKAKEAATLEGIGKFCGALAERQVRCAFFVPMMSDRYYSELLPDSAPRRPEHPLIDDFLAKLAKLPNVTYVDADPILRKTMATRRVFNYTDFHWNDAAAFEVGKALVDRMSEVQGLPASPWTHALEITKTHWAGGIATFMPLFVPPSEDSLTVKPNWSVPAGYKEFPENGAFEDVTTATPNPRLLAPTVALGDSFLDGLRRSGLAAQFNAYYRLRRSPKTPWTATEIVAALPPDTRWVLFEGIEISGRDIAIFSDKDNIEAAVAALRTGGSHVSP